MTYITRHRKEFPKQIKRLARERSNGLCEAEGADYNLEPDQRCNMPFGCAIQYDHIDAIDNDDISLENCAAVCVSCHAFKTAKIDIPKHAKVKRISDKHNGIRGAKKPWPSRKMNQAKFDNTKFVERY